MKKNSKPSDLLLGTAILSGGLYLSIKLYQELHCLLSNKCDM